MPADHHRAATGSRLMLLSYRSEMFPYAPPRRAPDATTLCCEEWSMRPPETSRSKVRISACSQMTWLRRWKISMSRIDLHGSSRSNRKTAAPLEI